MKKEVAIKERHTEHPITRRIPDPISELQLRTNNLFENFFNDMGDDLFMPSFTGIDRSAGLSPKFDVAETDDAFEVTAELPGMNEKDIEVFVEDNVLTVKGEKKEERDEKKRDYHLTERRYGSFYRAFPLPTGLDRGKVKACFKHGVLCLSLPKTAEAKENRRKIEVKAV